MRKSSLYRVAWMAVVLTASWDVPLAVSGPRGADARGVGGPYDAEAVRLAVEDMAATWPGRYDAVRHRAAAKAWADRAGALAAAAAKGDTNAAADMARLEQGVRDALLANPLIDFDRLLVLRRGFSKTPARSAISASLGVGALNAHTSDTIPRTGQFHDELIVYSGLRDAATGAVVFAATDTATMIDPVLDFDGRQLFFAMNGATQKNWRVWRIGIDGSGLRQVSPDDGADVGHFDPCPLADGRLIYASTASYQGLPCVFGHSSMTCLYLWDDRLRSGRQLTFEQDSDWCPTPLPNGRVMYLRWEYTDQSHANSRMLFTMNPDGTDQRVLRGSGSWFPGSFFHAKPVPGHASQVIGVAGGHHDLARSGRLLILDPPAGRRDGEGIVTEIPHRGRTVEPIVRDGLVRGIWPQFLMPAPLSEKYHLVAAKPGPDALWGIYLVDVFDNMTCVLEAPESALMWPVPVRTVARPPVVPDRVNLQTNTCSVFVADIHAGPGLAGVPRGTAKRVRVIEYYFSKRGMGGLYGTLGFDGPWDIKRVLGTVPVEADGSVHFEAPANSPIALQPLDAQGQALQLMRSWFVGMPGERVSCAGCHEPEDAASAIGSGIASRRAPSSIEPWRGPARGFSFLREVQPVLDAHCVRCHDGSDTNRPCLRGDRMLTDWATQMPGRWGGGGKFTEGYFQLTRHMRRPGIEGDRRMLTPMDFHFSQTELSQLLRAGHHGVRLDEEAWDRLATWHDLNAIYYGTWGEVPGLAPLVSNAVVRAEALRRVYVPMGPFPDYEAIPKTPPYRPLAAAAATDPVRPPVPAAPAGWPFDAVEAVRSQRTTAPSGTDGSLAMVLDDGPAPKPVSGRFVRVAAGPARWLSLAEVQVFAGGSNVARGCATSQSSTDFSGSPDRAVDGNTDGVFGNRSITHTGSAPDEWWEADLGAVVPIDGICLWNRTDGATERMGGVTVSVLDASRKEVWRDRTPERPGRTVTFLGGPDAALRFAWVPPGTMLAGGDGFDAEPARVARVERGFWMSRCEISNDQFRRFDPTHESRDEDRHGYQFGITGYDQDAPDQPAVRVSFVEAEAFCAWLSRKTGRIVRLPTGTEWEWACRAGAATPFWYGGYDADFGPFANLGDAMLANFAGNPYVQDWQAAAFKNPNRFDNWVPQDARFSDRGFVTEPVGRYRPNSWGLYDMHGNAWEWTAASGPEDRERVARGGSWYDRPFRATAAGRVRYAAHQRVFNVGFRVVVEEPASR